MQHQSETLRAGDEAPQFTLPTQRGVPQSLRDFLAKGPLLLAFHRGTWCPNCRRQFGELAHNSPLYTSRGFQVVAAVAQRSEKVQRYIEETGLPFNILIDESRDVLKAYGVWHRLGLQAWNIARPALFVIAASGRIVRIWVSDSQEEFPTHTEIEQAIEDGK